MLVVHTCLNNSTDGGLHSLELTKGSNHLLQVRFLDISQLGGQLFRPLLAQVVSLGEVGEKGEEDNQSMADHKIFKDWCKSTCCRSDS